MNVSISDDCEDDCCEDDCDDDDDYEWEDGVIEEGKQISICSSSKNFFLYQFEPGYLFFDDRTLMAILCCFFFFFRG